MKICLVTALTALPCAMLACGAGDYGAPVSAGDGGGAADGSGPPAAGPSFPVDARPVVVSTERRVARATRWSVNYGQWSPAPGDDVSGTESLVKALSPALLRIGGHAADASSPDPFDTARVDEAVAYAHAVGAEPLLQVPLIRDAAGKAPTPDTAAALVTYANVTRGYGIKYFSVGNEPDLYASEGSPVNPARGAIPNYAPADYCASARAAVSAMKAVDPAIQIIGPDLAWHYTATADWLSPILQGCGDLFDVVSVHRYPLNAGGATLDKTAADPAALRGVVASIRQLMELAGYGQKPLALTATNVAQDSPPPAGPPAGAPGSVPAGLWWADVLGSSASLQLWTAALPLIGDPDDPAVGLLGPPPARTPRPAYEASLLFAQHFGPTLLDVVSTPPGVSAYASRNQADDTTQIVLVNWNVASTGVAIEFTAPAPAPPVFLLPPLSVTALDVADHGPPAAFTYDDAQHAAGLGPRALAPAVAQVTIEDAGPPDASDAAPLPPPVCPGIAPPSTPITVLGVTNAGMLAFGNDAYGWGSYTYAGSGQTAPSIAATPDGDGIHATGRVLPTAPDADYTGFGLYYSSARCLDASSYTGLSFDFSGDLGGCLLTVIVSGSADVSVNDDPVRGTCSPDVPSCYGPMIGVTPGSGTSVRVPFDAIANGMPADRLDARTIISFGWQLAAPAMTPDGGPCSADFTVANVALY